MYQITRGACVALHECCDIIGLEKTRKLVKNRVAKLHVVHVKDHMRVFIKFKLSSTIALYYSCTS